MEKEEIIDDLKADLKYYTWELKDKYLPDRRRRYYEGYRDAVISCLSFLNAYDESLVEEIEEEYKEENDLPYEETVEYKLHQRSIETDGSEG